MNRDASGHRSSLKERFRQDGSRSVSGVLSAEETV